MHLSLSTIVIIGIVILLITGRVFRKRLKETWRSNMLHLVDQWRDPIKVAKLRIQEAKDHMEKIKNNIANLYAVEKAQLREYEKLKSDHDSLIQRAKQAKLDGNDDRGLTLMQEATNTEKAMKMIKSAADAAGKTYGPLERKYKKLGQYVRMKELSLKTLAARSTTMQAVSAVEGSKYGINDSLEEILNEVEDDVFAKEKMIQMDGSLDVEDEDIVSSDAKKAYELLDKK